MVTRAMTPTEQGEATELRPKLAGCPFCGSTRLVICGSGPLAAAPFAVSCTMGGCHGVIWALGHHKFDSREEAIAAWNRRPAPHPPEREPALSVEE